MEAHSLRHNMTVDHESDVGEEYNSADLEGLPDYQDLGGGITEYNTQYESDVREIISNAAENGLRVEFDVYDSDQGLAFHLFDGGINARYLDHEMFTHGWDITDMVEHFSNGKIETDGIEFYTIHEF